MLRVATFADVPVIVAITDAAYQKYVPLLGRKPQPMVCDYAVLLQTHVAWLWEEAGVARGVLVLAHHEDHTLVYSIAVDPSVQGEGLGGRLLALAESETLRAGTGLTKLYTNEKMTGNIAWYIRAGYKETQRVALPNSQTLVVHMQKILVREGQ